jgi:predicted  nucleic acid-binding Zn-ribbon protein
VHPDLAALLTLQEKDVAVAEADAAVAAIEPEVRALDDLLAAARRVLEAAQRDIRTALDRRDTLEGKIASYKNMQEQRKQKLEWVRGAKEASTLMAELDLARSVLVKEEAEFMRSGDAVTEAERRAAEAEMGLERVGEAQAAQRADIEIRRAALISGRESAVAARELAAVSVNAALLAKYERIRRGKTPLAIYALHADACGRCFTAVPTQRRAIIQRGGSIEGCEACGVLLYSE